MAILFSVGVPPLLGTCQNLGGRAIILKEMAVRLNCVDLTEKVSELGDGHFTVFDQTLAWHCAKGGRRQRTSAKCTATAAPGNSLGASEPLLTKDN